METSIILAIIAAALLGAGAVYIVLRQQPPAIDPHQQAQEAAEKQTLTNTLEMMRQQQSELSGRLTHLAELQETAKGELTRTMSEQLGNVFKTVNENLKESREKTTRSLGDLGERLQVIDKAQQEITALSGQVVELQHILDNKQARGAFGEAQLADIVTDGLPESAYSFQHTLSNGKRPDCLINLPNPPGPVVVDSKFPLEAYQKLRTAENDADTRAALTQMKTDTLKHATDISENIFCPGKRRMRR